MRLPARRALSVATPPPHHRGGEGEDLIWGQYMGPIPWGWGGGGGWQGLVHIYIYIYIYAHKIKGNLRAPDGFWAPETWADLLALDRLGWGSQRLGISRDSAVAVKLLGIYCCFSYM